MILEISRRMSSATPTAHLTAAMVNIIKRMRKLREVSLAMSEYGLSPLKHC
jgi:hypothetical protein